jgi:hypothetical protein
LLAIDLGPANMMISITSNTTIFMIHSPETMTDSICGGRACHVGGR